MRLFGIIGIGTRKTLLAVVLLCGGSLSTALAQGVSLGVVGGLNQSSASSDIDQDLLLTRTGFNVGAVLAFESASPVGFQLGASYTAKGFDLETGTPDVSGRVKITYVEVPLLVVTTIPTGPAISVSPRIFGGGAVGFKTGCDVVASGMGTSVSIPCDAGGGTLLKTVDVGAMFGGGLMIGAGSVSVVLDAAYTLGLVNIDDTGGPDKLKNKNLSFSIGVVFPLSVRRRLGL